MKTKFVALYTVLVVIFIGLITSCHKEEDLLSTVSQNTNSLEVPYKENTRFMMHRTPSGWVDYDSHDGIRYFYKLQDNCRAWHVLKIYLPKVRIKPIYRITTPSSTNPTFLKQNLGDWRNDVLGRNALALVNFPFFNLEPNTGAYGPLGSKAEVTHPFGYNSSLISSGYNPNQSHLLYFRIHKNKAYISYPASYPNYETLISGFHTDRKIDEDEVIGRTMIGIPYDGSDIVYIFVTGPLRGMRQGGATQEEAISALSDFGCSSVIMLDGSGSSQMVWNGAWMVVSSDPINRKIPAVLRMEKR